MVGSVARTRKDIIITGRTLEEAKTAVEKWFDDNSFDIIENTPSLIKARWGIGLATAAKYFEVSFVQAEGGLLAQTSGWISAMGVKEQEFSSSAMFGGIPRREGWKKIEELWALLQGLNR